MKEQFEKLCKQSDFIQAYNDFNATNLTELSLSQLFSVGTMFHLVQIKMRNDQELLLTDAYHDIVYQGKNYLATGDFTDISTISGEKEINNIGMTVKLSNVRTEYVNLITSKQLDKSDVKIDICFMNPNTGAPTESFNIFVGSVDKLTINIDYEQNESKNETRVDLDSIWAVLEKSARNHAADGVHRGYPGNANDTFFSRIGKWSSEAIWTSVR